MKITMEITCFKSPFKGHTVALLTNVKGKTFARKQQAEEYATRLLADIRQGRVEFGARIKRV